MTRASRFRTGGATHHARSRGHCHSADHLPDLQLPARASPPAAYPTRSVHQPLRSARPVPDSDPCQCLQAAHSRHLPVSTIWAICAPMTPFAWLLGLFLPACGAVGAAGLPAPLPAPVPVPLPADVALIDRPAKPTPRSPPQRGSAPRRISSRRSTRCRRSASRRVYGRPGRGLHRKRVEAWPAALQTKLPIPAKDTP